MKTYFISANYNAIKSSFKHTFHEITYFKPTFCIHCTGLVSRVLNNSKALMHMIDCTDLHLFHKLVMWSWVSLYLSPVIVKYIQNFGESRSRFNHSIMTQYWCSGNRASFGRFHWLLHVVYEHVSIEP